MLHTAVLVSQIIPTIVPPVCLAIMHLVEIVIPT